MNKLAQVTAGLVGAVVLAAVLALSLPGQPAAPGVARPADPVAPQGCRPVAPGSYTFVCDAPAMPVAPGAYSSICVAR